MLFSHKKPINFMISRGFGGVSRIVVLVRRMENDFLIGLDKTDYFVHVT